jgi:hypothetical protein
VHACFAGGQPASQGPGAPTCARASKQTGWRWRASGAVADTSEQYPERSDEPEFQFANGATAQPLTIQSSERSPARRATTGSFVQHLTRW